MMLCSQSSTPCLPDACRLFTPLAFLITITIAITSCPYPPCYYCACYDSWPSPHLFPLLLPVQVFAQAFPSTSSMLDNLEANFCVWKGVEAAAAAATAAQVNVLGDGI